MKSVTLAERTGVSREHISEIIRGVTGASVEWWKKAAEVLDCDIGDIIE